MCETCGCGETDEYTVRIPGEEIKDEHNCEGDCACDHDHDQDHHHHEDEHHHHDKEHGHHHNHTDEHDHKHKHKHHHGNDGDHHHSHHNGHSQEQSSEGARVIEISKDILSENNLTAERNRGFFEGRNILCLNLVSAPGSGKTTLLEKTIMERSKAKDVFVIEGDQQSMNDAERIKKTGVPVVQINTGAGCHLDRKR